MAETIPGGYFIGTDGEPHDANGKTVKKLSDKALAKARGNVVEMTEEQRAAAAQLRAAEQKQLEADEAADQAGAAADSAAADVKAADKAAKKAAKGK